MKKSTFNFLAILCITTLCHVNSVAQISFSSPVDYPSNGSISVAVGDFNQDGRPDVVYANRFGNNISVLIANGAQGNFNSPVNYAVGNNPSRLTIGDLNADGSIDIVVPNRGSNTLSLLLGNSDGTFNPATSVSPGIGTPTAVAIADLNGDTRQDLVTASGDNPGSISVLLASGSPGSFGTPSTPITTDTQRNLALGDLNGDGRVDLVLVSASATLLHFGNGDGTFGSQNNLGNIGGFNLQLGDLNDDNRLDIALGTSGGPILFFATGSPGNFATPVAANVSSGGNGDVAIADLNSDGRPDLAVTRPDVGFDGLVILQANGPLGNFNGPFGFIFGGSGARGRALATADLNLDGKPDIITCEENVFGLPVSIFFNTTPAPVPTITSINPASGPIGTTVTITGTNFDPVPSNNTVSFNGTITTSTSATATSLTVIVPIGAVSGPISVTTPNGIATSSTNFNVTAPIIISPQPATLSVCEGETTQFTIGASGTSGITYQWQKISPEAASLNGLRWDIPSLGSVSIDVDDAIDPVTVTTAMGGAPGITYAVTLRFRGVVETKSYLGGSTDGFWNANGTPDAFGYNVYELSVSDPPGKYYLNAGVSDLLYCLPIDYQQTINIKAGATVQLKAETRDNRILRNKDQFGNPIVITGIDPAPNPFNGQFIQMDVVSIDGVGYADVVDGGEYSGTTTNTLTVNTTGNVGTGTYRCKVMGNLAADAFSTTATLTVKPLPFSPAPVSNSGCSGTSISIGASGGINGQYRWYIGPTGGTPDAAQTNDIYATPNLVNTTSYYVAIHDGSCESPRTEVIATVLPLPTAPVVQPVNPVCPGSDITLAATGGTNGEYRWYDGAAVISGEVNSTLVVTNLTFAKPFSVSIHDGTCESNKTSVVASVKSCTAPSVESTVATAFVNGIVAINLQTLISDPEDDLDPASLQIIEQPQSGAAATLEGFNLNIDYSGIAFSGTDRVTVGICDLTNLCTEQAVTIELGGQIKIYNAVSPNGDGKNEIFFIQYIDLLPETQRNTVTIYNRWGDEVFQTKNYNNTSNVFKGESNTGDKLPSGTYFYKIIFASGKSRTGFLELKH